MSLKLSCAYFLKEGSSSSSYNGYKKIKLSNLRIEKLLLNKRTKGIK
jgi:hypothetical protein